MIWYESIVRIVAGKGKKVTGNKPEHLGKRFVHTAVHKVASPYAQHCTARCTTLHPRVHKVVSVFPACRRAAFVLYSVKFLEDF